MTEAAKPSGYAEKRARLRLDRSQQTRRVLAEIATTGDSPRYGARVFGWMVLRSMVEEADENARVFEEPGVVYRSDSDLHRRFRSLDRELRTELGAEGVHHVASAMLPVIERARAIEAASNY